MESPDSSYCLLPAMLPESQVLKCRCGVAGDGDHMIRLLNVHGDTVQCDACETWSHVACQRDERASSLKDKNSEFICDECDPAHYFKSITSTSKAKQEEFKVRMQKFKIPLARRLRPGQGALARHGNFWYPVRLIRKVDNAWIVQWWRENVYATDGIKPVQISAVGPQHITDSLWMDREGRRAIRLGRWKHPHDVATPDDILSDPSSISYTTTVDNILSPYTKTLSLLLWDVSQIPKDQTIPAKAWLESMKYSLSNGLVPYAGSLSITERAQISNWFEKKISKDKSARIFWLGLLPLAHAFTIYIAAGLKAQNPEKYENSNDGVLFEKAWWVQFSEAPLLSAGIDIEKECLGRLEEEMFEVSSRAGIAGHYQWGLDVGRHQDWNPYMDARAHLNHGDYEGLGNEDELEFGPNFKEDPQRDPDEKLSETVKTKPHPKPRPFKKGPRGSNHGNGN